MVRMGSQSGATRILKSFYPSMDVQYWRGECSLRWVWSCWHDMRVGCVGWVSWSKVLFYALWWFISNQCCHPTIVSYPVIVWSDPIILWSCDPVILWSCRCACAMLFPGDAIEHWSRYWDRDWYWYKLMTHTVKPKPVPSGWLLEICCVEWDVTWHAVFRLVISVDMTLATWVHYYWVLFGKRWNGVLELLFEVNDTQTW